MGARRHDRSHRGQGHARAERRRLPGNATRRTGHLSQSHAQNRALHRGAVLLSAFSVRRLEVLTSREFGGLCEVLIDCVEGGASVSFMRPMTLAKAADFWRGVAASMARGERALIVAEDSEGRILGTAQALWAEAENQPHRADIA